MRGNANQESTGSLQNVGLGFLERNSVIGRSFTPLSASPSITGSTSASISASPSNTPSASLSHTPSATPSVSSSATPSSTPSLQAADDYYVDAVNGDDDNDGTIEHPWKTIDRINRWTFEPGSNIYFKRGCTWREQLTVPSSGSAGLPITFGAYGSGAAPIIDGSDLIAPGASWTASTVAAAAFKTLVRSS